MSSYDNDAMSLINSMFSDDPDTYLQLHDILNQMFVDSHKKKNQEHPYEGDHASDYKQSFEGDWRYCYRKSILQEMYHFEGEELSAKRIRINDVGWYLHLMIQHKFKESGRAVRIEHTHRHPKYGIHYSPDIEAKIVEMFGEEIIIVEIKTMNKESFEKAVKTDDPRKGHLDAYKQVQIYMFLSGLRKALIYLFCKDNSEFHHYIVDYNEEFLQPYIERIETRAKLKLIFESRDGLLPIRVCQNSQTTRAKSCPVASLCWMATTRQREPFKRTIQIQQNQNASLIHKDE